MASKDTNLYKDFNVSPFKKELPPKNDSEKTKKELKYLSTIDLDKQFFQEKDDLIGNFFHFLDSKKVKYDKKLLRKIVLDAVDVILELKDYFKRPRPFKLDHDFKDPSIKSTKGYSYPSGHSTQSNLLGLVLNELVKQKDLKATPEQIKAEIEEQAASYEDPKEVTRWYYSDPNRLADIESLVLENNVVKYVTEIAKVADKKVTFEELSQLN